MAWQYRGVSSGVFAGASGATLTIPSGTQEGDGMCAWLCLQTERTYTHSWGTWQWTAGAPGTEATSRFQCRWKRAGASEGSLSPTWSGGTSNGHWIVVSFYDDLGRAPVLWGANNTFGSSTASHVAPSIDAGGAENFAVAFFALVGNVGAANTWTLDSPLTERADLQDSTRTSGAAGTAAIAAAGATGTFSATATQAFNGYGITNLFGFSRRPNLPLMGVG